MIKERTMVKESILEGLDKLKEIGLPENWYVDDADSLNDAWEHAGNPVRLPSGWFAVCTPDDGVMAAFPTHELAFSYMVIIIYGRGGQHPARADYTNYKLKEWR